MVRVEAVKVFTDDPRKGNLAGVVLDAGSLSDLTMQSIAHTVQASETSFVLPSAHADIRVRWFTPNNEVGICVHATIAAVGAWAQSTGDRRRSFSVETRNAVLPVEREGENIFINVPGYSLEERGVDAELVASHLGLGVGDLVGEPRIVRIYDDLELVVPVQSLATLERLEPRLDTYAEICRVVGVTGICLFARQAYSGTHDVHMREFAPLYGYLEDPLCGMASGCVLTFLRASDSSLSLLKVEQGQFCGTSGTIVARHDPETGIWIGGEYAIGEPLEVGES